MAIWFPDRRINEQNRFFVRIDEPRNPYPGEMHRMHVHPHPCASPPPQPERLGMRKDEAVGNKKKIIKLFLKSIKCNATLEK
jgi:hypothetical protein